MVRPLIDIEKEIRELQRTDQEQLLRVLLEELEGPSDPGVEKAWLEEVQRRSRELEEGRVEPVPANEVFALARSALRQ